MGISWLWHFTHTDGKDDFVQQNENRAANFYSLWKKLGKLRRAIARLLMGSIRQQALRRQIDSLPEHVLRDVGLQREPDGALVTALVEPKPVLNRYRVAQPSIQVQSALKPAELQSGSISNCCRSQLLDSADNPTGVSASSVGVVSTTDSLQPTKRDSKNSWQKASCF